MIQLYSYTTKWNTVHLAKKKKKKKNWTFSWNVGWRGNHAIESLQLWKLAKLKLKSSKKRLHTTLAKSHLQSNGQDLPWPSWEFSKESQPKRNIGPNFDPKVLRKTACIYVDCIVPSANFCSLLINFQVQYQNCYLGYFCTTMANHAIFSIPCSWIDSRLMWHLLLTS